MSGLKEVNMIGNSYVYEWRTQCEMTENRWQNCKAKYLQSDSTFYVQ